VSEGRDLAAIEAIGAAFASPPGVELLDVHVDADHHRSVFWLMGGPGALAEALVRGAREATARVDLQAPRGVHPHVGALDVAPIVFLDGATRGAACAEALLAAGRIGDEVGLPVYLYGLLASGRTRAELRAGGVSGLRERGTAPDFGPSEVDPTRGAVLVAARPPLVAINFEIDGELELARAIAADVRKLPGVRALGLWLDGRGVAQVSCNVEDLVEMSPVALLDHVRARANVRTAELVGLAPRAALEGWPEDVPVRYRRVLEDLVGGRDAAIRP
jgi:glutamate formiminotransferase